VRKQSLVDVRQRLAVPRDGREFVAQDLDAGGNVRRITRAAIHGTIAARAERQRRRNAALRADGFKARTLNPGGNAFAGLRAARLAAFAAALRLILESLLREKLLLARGEDE
jgi:hypothetical protein